MADEDFPMITRFVYDPGSKVESNRHKNPLDCVRTLEAKTYKSIHDFLNETLKLKGTL